jgi:two-component system CheB/CheR fusion protein
VTDERLDDLPIEDDADVALSPALENGFRRLIEKLHLEHGVDFRDYKEPSLLRRVQRRMAQVHLDTFESYITYLDRTPSEKAELINSILINVTRFFRDPEAWATLRDDVLPRLLEDAAVTRSLRVWSAGCSSGEEPYTAAILIAEALGHQARDFDVKIYATDVDDDALATGRAGLYRLEQLKDVPEELFGRYFLQEGQAFRFRRDVRKWCIFGRHDLAQDPPLSHIDLLICRNVLIYFGTELQDRIFPRFQYAIRDRGYLFLGKSETMLSRSRRFAPVNFKWRIFERLPTAAEGPGPLTIVPTEGGREVRAARGDGPHAVSRLQAIVEMLNSAVVVIDPSDTIALWNPAAERMFDVSAYNALGRKFRDLDISYRIEGLRSRVEEVKTTHSNAHLEGARFTRRSGQEIHVSIAVSPLYIDRRRLGGILVIADDVTDMASLRDEVARVTEQSATANEELQSTNEELETTNEELQSTNEELETTNEELQSTNEELETTVEELRSINAELATLNAELERRTTELNHLDRYHKGVLDGADEAVFVLDGQRSVSTWNRTAARLWGLRSEDAVGRLFPMLPIGEVVRLASPALDVVLATRRRQVVPRVPYVRAGGHAGEVTLRLAPVLGDDGQLLGVIGMAAPPEGDESG